MQAVVINRSLTVCTIPLAAFAKLFSHSYKLHMHINVWSTAAML